VRLLRWLFRRRREPTPLLGESECYSRCHGERSGEVHVVVATLERPRLLPRLSGDYLRRCFEKRLDSRRAALH
jgi:hypothetical protein